METPDTRAEFERNFHLLHRQIEDGKFHLPSDYPLDSLARVRFLPNGRIDFLSVDESARLNANMIAQYSDKRFQEQLKNQAQAQQEPDAENGDTPKP